MGRPSIKKFTEIVNKCGGNLTKVAESFKTSRTEVYRWIKAEPSIKAVVDDARMRLFDECLATARVVSLGIPDIQNGKIVGWIERPDSGMLRYLMGCLGKYEGFGENIDVTSNGEKVNEPIIVQVIDSKSEVIPNIKHE